LFLVIGLLLFVLLATKTGFLGSLIGGYENNEPTNIGEFLSTIDLYGGQYSYQGTYDITTHSYDQYYTSSDLGVITVIVIDDLQCNEFLSLVNQEDNTTSYVILEGRQTLDLTSGYLFCNFKNNLALQVSDFSTMSDYVNSFETFNEITTPPEEEEEEEEEEESSSTTAEGEYCVDYSDCYDIHPITGGGYSCENNVCVYIPDMTGIEDGTFEPETEGFNNNLLLIGLVVLVIIIFIIIEVASSKKKVVIKHKRAKKWKKKITKD